MTKERTSQVIVQNVLITEVGVVQTVESENEAGGFQENQAVPVTFALSTEDSLKLSYAESFAVKLRLALRGAGDSELLTDEQRSYDQQGSAQ